MRFYFFFFAFVIVGLPVMANPIKTVGTAIVNEGANTIEFRSGWSADNESQSHDGRFQTRQMYDHGFTDFYALRLTAWQDNQGTHDMEHNSFIMDNRVQVFERAQSGFDGGFRVSYVLRDGDKKPDIAEMRWINHFYFGEGYEFRHHIILQRQVGEDARSGINPELRWQLTRPTIGKHRAGVEMFNEWGNLSNGNTFEEQFHDAGIIFTGPLIGRTRYHTGYRHGISDAAPDHTFKFFVGYDF